MGTWTSVSAKAVFIVSDKAKLHKSLTISLLYTRIPDSHLLHPVNTSTALLVPKMLTE
jgi:hypothetical protein